MARNPDLAMGVIEADDEIDRLRDQVFRELLTYMMGDPSTIPRALELVLISRNLERMADHATNIAEDVVYLVRGEDIRERGEKEMRKGLRRRGEEAKARPWPGAPPAAARPSEEEFLALIREAGANAVAAAHALQEMTNAGGDLRAGWRHLEAFEQRGDELTHEMHRRLNRAFITPISRPTLQTLISRLDDVVDIIEAAAARMVMYAIPQPTEAARRLAELIAAAAAAVAKALEGLSSRQGIEDACVEINRLENAADAVLREALAALFRGATPPADILKWKEIYETLEEVTDRCEDVANAIEAIALRHA